MRIWRKKGTKVIVAVVAGVAALSLIANFTGSNPVANAIRTVATPFQTGFAYIAQRAKGTVEFIYEMKGYKEENERLVAENTNLKQSVKDTEHYRKEIEELQALLNLQNSITQYRSVAASVIGYSANTYYDEIEINRGSMHGISVGDVVITPDGLVGSISEAGLNHSIISSVISGENSIGVIISRTGDIGVVEGDEELRLNSQCKLTFVDKDVNIMDGDFLETSGSGSVYPGGIRIGIIRQINMDNLGMLNYAVVETAVNFRDMHEVLVLDTTA